MTCGMLTHNQQQLLAAVRLHLSLVFNLHLGGVQTLDAPKTTTAAVTDALACCLLLRGSSVVVLQCISCVCPPVPLHGPQSSREELSK